VQTRLSQVAIFTLLLLSAARPAAGANFFANVTYDGADEDLDDGICDGDAATPNPPDTRPGHEGEFVPQCTLRAAVQNANVTPAADLIELGNATYVLSLSGAGEDDSATGDLDIKTPMEISGNQFGGGSFDTVFIDAKRLKDRVFDVLPGGSLELGVATVENGKTAKGESGGCIRSATNLQLLNIFLFRCSSSDDGGCVSVTGGTSSFTNTIFSTCRAKDEGGGLELAAGATATFLHATAGACRAATGGGIASRGNITLRDVTIDDNSAKIGGGIALLGAGTTTINSTTISENQSVNLDASQSTGGVTLANTIVWGAKTSDCLGTVTSAGGNLEGEVSCGFDQTNDQQSQDPMLAPLNDYGKFVPVRPPTKVVTTLNNVTTTTYSPAIDHGIDGATCIDPDARLVARQDVPGVGVAICDSGAAEFNVAPVVP
jgi:hypothetical protein